MTTVTSSVSADVSPIAGPILIGYLLQWGLFGALCVQVYTYHVAFPNDTMQRKALVYGVYTAELIQTIFYTKTSFEQFATGFGNAQILDEAGLRELWFAVPILSSAVAFVVQVFYAYRIKVLAESKVCAIIITVFALVQLGGGITTGIFARKILSFTQAAVLKILISSGIWNACSALCDIIIAASMTYYLSRRKTTWKPTQRIVQKLTRLVIETGTLTASIAITNFALTVMPGNKKYFLTSSAILGKLYSCTMMVVLNSRIVFSHHESASKDLSSSVSNQEISRRTPFPSHGGITVTHEHGQWSIPLESYKIHENKGLEDCNEV